MTDLVPERGAAALVDGHQVALVRTHDDVVLAVQQLDPYSDAHIMARGIVGTRDDIPTVTSPMYKQVFDLRTGDCIDPVGEEPVRPRHHEGSRGLAPASVAGPPTTPRGTRGSPRRQWRH